MLQKESLPSPPPSKTYPMGLKTIMELFDVGPAVAITALCTAMIILFVAIIYFIHSAPPSTITISSGPEGSTFEKNAAKYAAILSRNGVKVKILKSEGSLQNLRRLEDPSSHVDVGIIQAGITDSSMDDLVSLGSISYQPLLVFYRGPILDLLSNFAGKKIAVGPVGSGSRNFAIKLLAANGIIEGGATPLLNLEADEAAQELLNGKIDVAFVMSESTSLDIMRKLLRSNDVRLFSFKQANAYSRKIEYLNILELPQGAIDLGLNIPAHDVSLLGPMIELVATKKLHPALSDLLLEAATEVHSRPGVFQRRGEFPTDIEHAIHISEDATRFYKSGKSFLYRILPFWLASLTSRIIVVFIPTLVILIPAMKSIPAFFRWRTQSKIHQRYRDLLLLEKEFLLEADGAKLDQLRKNFDRIEHAVNRMKVPASFADQFYGLRGHIDYVRQLVINKQQVG